MYIPFDDLPGDARLWIYQADRTFTEVEASAIENSLLHLCQTWTAHGAPLRSSFRLEYRQFILLAVDERATGASGCSIDGTVRSLKEMQERLGLDLFNRQQIAFLDGATIRLHPIAQLKTLFDAGILSPQSITFNNTLTTKAEWERDWRVAAKDTWLSRFLPQSAGVR